MYCTCIYCATFTVEQMRLEGCKKYDTFFYSFDAERLHTWYLSGFTDRVVIVSLHDMECSYICWLS